MRKEVSNKDLMIEANMVFYFRGSESETADFIKTVLNKAVKEDFKTKEIKATNMLVSWNGVKFVKLGDFV